MKNLFLKMRGGGHGPPRMPIHEILYSLISAFIGIGICAWLSWIFFEQKDLTMVVGSLGASAVLVFGAPHSTFSQPRNLIGGHVISALIGVLSYRMLPDNMVIASAAAVSCALAAMALTRTVHPPGGGTALIAVIGSEKMHTMGFLYVFLPAGAGALVLLIAALILNNLPRDRKYPQYWF